MEQKGSNIVNWGGDEKQTAIQVGKERSDAIKTNKTRHTRQRMESYIFVFSGVQKGKEQLMELNVCYV